VRTLRIPALAVALVALPACHRPGPPSPAYAHAREQFTQLYADELSDAFLDPRMEDVEAELKTVPKESADAKEAQALLDRIAQGRKEAQAEQDRLNRGMEEALAPPVMGGGADQEAAPGGAAARTPTMPTVGMPTEEFLKDFGDCFHPIGEARVGDAGPVAKVYGLAETQACQARFEYFQTRVVVADASKVLGNALKSSYQPPPEGGATGPAQASPDAGAARAAPSDGGQPTAR
jgi:hypothetical protein